MSSWYLSFNLNMYHGYFLLQETGTAFTSVEMFTNPVTYNMCKQITDDTDESHRLQHCLFTFVLSGKSWNNLQIKMFMLKVLKWNRV